MGKGDTPLGIHVDRLAAAAPDETAIVCDGIVLTRAELAANANRLAHRFAESGVTFGSMVTIGLPNSFHFYEAVIAAWKVGAIPQPVSHRLPAAELRSIVELANSAVVVGLDPGDGRPWLPEDSLGSGAGASSPMPAVTSPAWKAPTSGGSTGRPKLIVSTNPGTFEAVTAAGESLRIGANEVFLCTAPLYHNSPFAYSLIALLLGGSIVLMPRFDAAASLELAERHRATWVYLVPTMMHRILRLPEAERLARDLSSVQTFYHGAAPCPPSVKQAWIDWLGPDSIVELYSGTEAQSFTWITGREWLAHRGAVGRVMRGEMVIRDENGNSLATGTIGEVWMRPPPGAVTYQYVGATAKRDGDWESLGDMGWFDEDGYLYLTDRQSDMILIGGSNVYPAEIEAALSEHPAVLSACVIGLPDKEYGNIAHALVETTRAVSDDEFRRHLSERLDPHKIPRTFERSTVPLRDDAGKVRRSSLRAERLLAQDRIASKGDPWSPDGPTVHNGTSPT